MPDGTQQGGAGGGMPAQQGNAQGQGGTPGQGQQNGAQGDGQGQGQAMTYDTWLAQQPDNVKTLIDVNTQGLRNTVQATRQERDALQTRLAEITKALGNKNPDEAKRLLEEASSQLEAANARADFYAEAVKPDVGCTNPSLAFMAAQQAELIDKKGRVNWVQMKTQYPELFRAQQTATPTGHAGTGTSNPATGKASMNDFIRRSAGR